MDTQQSTFTSELRPVSLSEINKYSFDSNKTITSFKKLGFYNNDSNDNYKSFTKVALEDYDRLHNKHKGFGYWGRVKLACNVTNWDFTNKVHFVTVLESYHCPVSGWYYCLNSYDATWGKLGNTLKSESFKTLKALKEYVKTNQGKL